MGAFFSRRATAVGGDDGTLTDLNPGNAVLQNDNLGIGYPANTMEESGDSGEEDAEGIVLHERPEIQQRTMEEERAWMRLKFNEERANQRDPTDGGSLKKTTVETMQLMELPIKIRTSCVLKISNHLDVEINTPQVFVAAGRQIYGDVSHIVAHTSEAFSFQGNGSRCYFLVSFGISNGVRLAVAGLALNSGKVHLFLGFPPEGVPTDGALLEALDRLKSVPDFHTSDEHLGDGPRECFISHGLLLARAHMSAGPRSVVEVDILKVTLPRSVGMVGTPPTPNNLEGLVQITNYLNVTLGYPRGFTPTPGIENALPAEVLPSAQETFFRCRNRFVEAMLVYEIVSTDLGLVVAFRVQENNNAFSAAFVPLPAETDERTFNLAMDQRQWKSHLYRKYANAKDGEQEIQIRNIRARVSMTDAGKPQVNITIFTV